MPDFVLCPRVSEDGWVAHPVTGEPRDRHPPEDHIVPCRSCGARIACSSAEDRVNLVPICDAHLDEPWPPTVAESAR